MNRFITASHKLVGARMASATNYDFEVYRNFASLYIKPYTGSTITAAVAGVKTAATSATLAAGTSNTGQAAINFLLKVLGWLRVTSATNGGVSHVGTFLIATKDRITPDNAVTHYTF